MLFSYFQRVYIVSLMLFSICFSINDLVAQDKYSQPAETIANYDFDKRTLPAIPPKDRKIRVIIDADAKNEIDDQWAITLALLSPDRLQIEGFVAANYDNRHGGPQSIENSYQEIITLLEKTGYAGKIPVYKGSHPMRYKYEPSESEGVDFIIKQAMEATPEDPIWVIALGSATNLASAYLKEPKIVDRVVFFWHGRTRWPDKLWNFNVFGDRNAAITLFHAPVPLVLFDTGTYLTCPMEESEKHVKPYGEIGAYLHEYRLRSTYFQRSDKGFFDLGDIAALVDPDIALWQEVSCPEIAPDLSYRFKGNKGNILRCYHIDRDKTFALFYDRLKKLKDN